MRQTERWRGVPRVQGPCEKILLAREVLGPMEARPVRKRMNRARWHRGRWASPWLLSVRPLHGAQVVAAFKDSQRFSRKAKSLGEAVPSDGLLSCRRQNAIVGAWVGCSICRKAGESSPMPRSQARAIWGQLHRVEAGLTCAIQAPPCTCDARGPTQHKGPRPRLHCPPPGRT